MNYRLDSHCHTIASGHSYSTIREMAEEAAARGLELLAITEHSLTMPGTCHEFYFSNLRTLPRKMYGIEVLFGSELNIMDTSGAIDMPQALALKMDVNVASLHIPCIRPGSRQENTRALIGAMENPAVQIIGHPDDARYPVDMEELVRAAKEQHVLLELNNSSLSPQSSRKDARTADIEMLRLCEKHGTMIILNSDAHSAFDVGNCCYSVPLLEELGFPEELVVNRSVELYKSYLDRNE